MGQGLIPFKALTPGILQVAHIGADGLHGKDLNMAKRRAIEDMHDLKPFHGTIHDKARSSMRPRSHNRGYGGWGHPADHEHCLKILTSTS